MSQTVTSAEDSVADPDAQAAAWLREHRDTLERLADTDLPIAEDAQRGLDWLEDFEAGETDD